MMVSTRGKKRTADSNKTLEEANEVAENSLAEGQTSQSLTLKMEEFNVDGQSEDKVEVLVEEADNEGYEEMPGEEESEKLMKVDNDSENMLVTEMNSDNKAESEQNTSEDDEIDDQEDLMWEDEEESSEEDSEENFDDEDEASEEEAIKGDDDDDDNEVSTEEASGDDDNDEISKAMAAEFVKGDERGAILKDGREAKLKEDGSDAKLKENGSEAKLKEGREAKEHNSEKVEAALENNKNANKSSRKKKVRVERTKKVDSKDEPESSGKRKGKKRVEGMGVIFMCSSKTKNDCFQYRVLGLPESKIDIVEKIYTGMRLFLYDVDLKLMYGIYKAAAPGGYNIEPKAFKSQFPSQVRFTVLDDCLPLPEEKFKKVIKENYFTKTKFDCQLKLEQVKKLCRLFLASGKKGHPSKKSRINLKAEKQRPVPQERSKKRKVVDERHLPVREGPHYREQRPLNRPRKAIISPPRLPLPAPLASSTVAPYVYERTSDVDAYRRDPYLYRDMRDPPLVSRRDRYRDVRDPYLERDYPYVEHSDPYRDGRDTSSRHRDPYYLDGRALYLERRDPYRDGRGPDVGIHNLYRDGQDSSYLERRNPYRDAMYSEPSYNTYRRDPLSDRRDAYREDQGGGGYRDSFRRDELLVRGSELRPFSYETRHHLEIGTRDSYVSDQVRPSSYGDPIYSTEYPSRAVLGRVYRL